ncbi:MAG: hypothetical protein DBP02_19825 [gamma proteobacterium symbiont of Ctena orbiculata]|nr:MAG: hypothetical protein DBP02_19825 [gamma proteobacterium symbiont of Ctena orbiculata]
MNPKQNTLNRGVEILKPLMTKHKFKYVELDSGDSSGGQFASGCFRTSDRRFRFSVRYSLGKVFYKIQDREITHADYMRAAKALGHTTRDNQYPAASQSSEISDSFTRLCNDITEAHIFFSGSDDQVNHIFDWVDDNPEKKGIGAV